MDTRVTYQHIIKHVLLAHATSRSQWGGVYSHVIFDDQRGRYLVLDMGWDHDKYWHITPIHLDLIDGKIWVQYDQTEEGVATDLLDANVPKDDIVLGFHPQNVRKYTEFADIPDPIVEDPDFQPSQVSSMASRVEESPSLSHVLSS